MMVIMVVVMDIGMRMALSTEEGINGLLYFHHHLLLVSIIIMDQVHNYIMICFPTPPATAAAASPMAIALPPP